MLSNFLNNISSLKEKILSNIFTTKTIKKNNYFYTKFLNGDIFYYDEQGNYHNDDEPAINTRFRKEYFYHGKRHRLDGPAVTFLHSTEKRIIYTEYWLYGEKLDYIKTNEQFEKLIKLRSFI